MKKERKEKCDIKVWSGACEHKTYSTLSDKYLCDTCGTIVKIDHEVSHEGFVHIKGDEETVS
ncbi:MAG TPA: hypothetical protein VK187_10475 [Geobacteraceae bacterium]|nr:hypothetical protein [Geobacteraceae bacterium]